MNSDKSVKTRQRGNALIYVLLGLALLAALTVLMTKQSDDGGDDIAGDQAIILATQMLSYTASAQNVINQMMDSGSTVATLDFTNPASATFDTAPYGNKFYHPEGGGFNVQKAQIPPFESSAITPSEGWYFTATRNVEWTPTTAFDVIMGAYNISPSVCNAINKKINGTAAPVLLSGSSARALMTNYSADAFTKAVCPSCEGYPTLCIANADGSNPSLYSIILGR